MKTLIEEKRDIHSRGLKEFVTSEYGIHDRLNAIERIESAKRDHRKRVRIFRKRVRLPDLSDDDVLCDRVYCVKTYEETCSS